MINLAEWPAAPHQGKLSLPISHALGFLELLVVESIKP